MQPKWGNALTLSPRILPPDIVDDGSTASTQTLFPALARRTPSASMKVDLPAPGGPMIPRRIGFFGFSSLSVTPILDVELLDA